MTPKSFRQAIDIDGHKQFNPVDPFHIQEVLLMQLALPLPLSSVPFLPLGLEGDQPVQWLA
jgi:hypothetical protein